MINMVASHGYKDPSELLRGWSALNVLNDMYHQNVSLADTTSDVLQYDDQSSLDGL